MRNEDGREFDVKPRGSTWRPDPRPPTLRMKIWLQAQAHRAREEMDLDSFDDRWNLTGFERVAVGREPFWIGKTSAFDAPTSDVRTPSLKLVG